MSDLGYRAFGDGLDQYFPSREVNVDRCAGEARVASDVHHACFRIAGQRLEGRVQDSLHAALGVGASRSITCW
jgi:hypothetical protein